MISGMRLEVKFPPIHVHGSPSEEPLVLAKLGVKDALLKPSHLESEPRPELLEPGSRLAVLLAVDVPMVPHEYEVALVVKGHHLASLKLRLVGEQRA